MKKTLKAFINAGLLILFVSHSYAVVFSLSDLYNQAGSVDDSSNILDKTTHPRFNAIDDTFDGTVTFNFTITYDLFPSQNNIAIFQLMNSAGNIPIAIGTAWYSNNWDGFRLDEGNGITPLTFGSNPVVVGESQAFTMTIDYNAGALDTGTLIMAGDTTVYDIGDYDYSFSEIYFSTGVNSDNIASATNMTVEIVPEPATYALLSGALALVFVALRRRIKA